VEIVVTAGIARPNACGHAITITVIARAKANGIPAPVPNQKMKVPPPTKIAINVK
jgi:hypothetical protein